MFVSVPSTQRGGFSTGGTTFQNTSLSQGILPGSRMDWKTFA